MMVQNRIRKVVVAGLGAAALLLAGCSEMTAFVHDGKTVNVTLSGSQQVPPVATSGRGEGTVTVADDGTVTGNVRTMGVDGVAAHIHTGARGQNGPVAVGMVKTGDGTWGFPAGARLNEAQLAAFRAGNTYVNVHTAANKGGEVRGQLMP
jgi:hypothetical protein